MALVNHTGSELVWQFIIIWRAKLPAAPLSPSTKCDRMQRCGTSKLVHLTESSPWFIIYAVVVSRFSLSSTTNLLHLTILPIINCRSTNGIRLGWSSENLGWSLQIFSGNFGSQRFSSPAAPVWSNTFVKICTSVGLAKELPENY